MDSEHEPSPEPFAFNLLTERVVGNGSFGVVFEARIVETGEVVAIKKVLQDRRFKNRELQVIKALKHPNIVALKHYFYQAGDKEEEVYLNLVLEYIPDTVYKITRQYTKQRQLPPLLCVKLYVYQLCRSLAYLHATGVCHRDIKPQNLLVDSRTHTLKLCDFGSAKALLPGEPSVAYICSRYYRAPELIFGATDYTTAIDIWSSGCVAGELLLGHPLFPGNTGVDQLVEIIKTLGTPRPDEVIAMNPAYTDFKFPQVKPYPWARLFRSARAPPEAIDLISGMLQYVPAQRLTAIEAAAHPFFDELRDPATRLPDTGGELPPLFNFTPEELRGITPELRARLIPPHARNADNWPSAPPPPPPPAASASARSVLGGGGGLAPRPPPPRSASGGISAAAAPPPPALAALPVGGSAAAAQRPSGGVSGGPLDFRLGALGVGAGVGGGPPAVVAAARGSGGAAAAPPTAAPPALARLPPPQGR